MPADVPLQVFPFPDQIPDAGRTSNDAYSFQTMEQAQIPDEVPPGRGWGLDAFSEFADGAPRATNVAYWFGTMESFVYPNKYRKTVEQTLLFSQTPEIQTDSITAQLDSNQKLTYAKATNGYIYMASGLRKMVRWNGFRPMAVQVGVDAPTTAPTIAFTGTGSIGGTYTAYMRFIDDEGNPSNLSPISNEITSGFVNGGFSYTNLPIPTQKNVVKRQILRNSRGQADVYYVDVELTDLSITTATSTNTSKQLRTKEPVPLFDSENRDISGRHGIPPKDKPIIVYYKDRLFAAGSVPYSEGAAQVTTGSTTVTGVGTDWHEDMAGREFHVVGVNNIFTISSIDSTAQTLTLSAAYNGATDKFAVYTIVSDALARNQLHFSEPALFDSWPNYNVETIGLTGRDSVDEVITAMISAHSFLYIFQQHHVYRLSFFTSPGIDGAVFLAARRGCVNPRCLVQVDEWIYCLDDRGVYRFTGSEQTEDLSQPIQNIFSISEELTATRVNWEAQDCFHAQHDQSESTIRWFVALSGSGFPRHAICINYNTGAWWIEEWVNPISASTVLQRVSKPQPALGSKYRKIYAYNVGTLDGAVPDEGTTRGTVTAAGIDWLEDSTSSFASSNLVGNPIGIFDGKGKHQFRIVASVSGTRITVVQPWSVRPDTTSKYQLGAFPWSWRSGDFRWTRDESATPHRIQMAFQKTTKGAQYDLRIYENQVTTPTVWAQKVPRTPKESEGITVEADKPDVVVDMTDAKSWAQWRMDKGQRERYVQSSEYVSIEFRGVANQEPTIIHDVSIEGAEENR